MRNPPTSPLSPPLLEAVGGGEAWLLDRQGADGAWRDYEIEVGSSDAWATAFVGAALAEPPLAPAALAPLHRAADRLHSLRRPTGWGFNSAAATDADSTAWALSLLALIDDRRGVEPLALLGRHVDEGGGVHTFADPARFGAWAGEHVEVTAVVGSLLIELGAPGELLARLRERCMAQREGGRWPAFWWATPAYATARAVSFLRSSGGLRGDPRGAVGGWARRRLVAERTSFGLAHLTQLGVDLGEAELADACARRLLELRRPGGDWAPSRVLLVQPQRGGRAPRPAADVAGLMSTAAAVSALKSLGRAIASS